MSDIKEIYIAREDLKYYCRNMDGRQEVVFKPRPSGAELSIMLPAECEVGIITSQAINKCVDSGFMIPIK